MESLFEHTDYKAFLGAALKKNGVVRGTQSTMARHLKCQPSYLYQVLKRKADLTEDQALRVTSFFEFDHSERDYFLNLVRYGKASSTELKTFFLAEIERQRLLRRNLKNSIAAEQPSADEVFWEYYVATSLPSQIHILTSSKNYQSLKAISLKLALPEEEVLRHLKRLLEKDLVGNKDRKWFYKNASNHFEKESKFNIRLQKNRLIDALNSINLSVEKDSVHFSSQFTIDSKSLEKLRALLADYVKSSHKIIHLAGTDEAHVLNIDLFRS